MKITIKKDKYKQIYVNCPICNEICDIEYNDNKLTYPLICCWFCTKPKESKFIIDSPIDKFINLLSTNNESFELDLLFIKKIANSDDIDYKKTIKDVLQTTGKNVNSYNIADIRKTYPSYNLDHDGCLIYIEVELKDGSLEQIQFSGD